MEESLKVLWAVPCSYYGSEILSDLYKFFEDEKFNEMGELNFVGAYDGADASKKLCDHTFDLIVLDQDLPYIEITEKFLRGISFHENFFIIRLTKTKKFTFEGIDEEGFHIIGDPENASFQNIKEILEKFF